MKRMMIRITITTTRSGKTAKERAIVLSSKPAGTQIKTPTGWIVYVGPYSSVDECAEDFVFFQGLGQPVQQELWREAA